MSAESDPASPSTTMPPCRANTTATARCVTALLIVTSTFACADGPLPSPKEAGAAASTSGSPSARFAFVQLAHEMNQAPRVEQSEPVVKFDATASGLAGQVAAENGQEAGAGAGVGGAGDGAVLSFTSSNEYPAITWSPWTHLAEPHREAVLRAESTKGDPDNDVFVWTMPGENGASYEGRYVSKASDLVLLYRYQVSGISVASVSLSLFAAYKKVLVLVLSNNTSSQ